MLWIGANDRVTEGSFVWVNGMNVTNDVMHWGLGQPDNNENNEDCVNLLSALTDQKILANDAPCSQPNLAICEKLV